jgi:hypothetical protein
MAINWILESVDQSPSTNEDGGERVNYGSLLPEKPAHKHLAKVALEDLGSATLTKPLHSQLPTLSKKIFLNYQD